jgi:DNA-directed RNA polymerase beta' subunit
VDLRSELRHVILRPLDVAMLRERAPGIVHDLVTYDRHTRAPAPGGLFDEAIFGQGASLDPPRIGEDEIVTRERAIRFGRCVLSESVPHPFPDGAPFAELPVLPPDLRPIVLRDREIVMSDLNIHYRDVLRYDGRVRKLREIGAALRIIESDRAELARAVACLLDNERSSEPKRDDAGRVLTSLRAFFRPDVSTALHALDQAVGAGADLAKPLPLRLHRTVATLFACGFVVQRT